VLSTLRYFKDEYLALLREDTFGPNGNGHLHPANSSGAEQPPRSAPAAGT